ncbi:tyrosine-type recombinase/integrase [Paenibacillus sp. N3.4]|uniref:tyrosine-type recombinase/integrase n=1 Tax=Paenibacillus sp. N3.4 TaxID=2603222 RepID=UPI0011C762F4|nr:tyrosine-type recombinase/integrase [Paenibacillus sp. N3.4]TXK74579.1 tyrosine-type recombinase/integrase [Paenibacillus sp. N3.4]
MNLSVFDKKWHKRYSSSKTNKFLLYSTTKSHRFLVCTKIGRPYLKKNFRDIWIRLLQKTGFRQIRFHDLRHTCASLLLGLGILPKVVQERLGHSSVTITLDTYSHLVPNMQQDAANSLQNLLE